jgi:PhoH-like ATPase
MGALKDNLEVLGAGAFKDKYERETTMEVMQKKIVIRSINFMRGRTFFKRFVIVDEAQNLTPKQMKALLTRAGPGTKMVLLGDLEQIDTPYLDARSSGLAYVIQRMKGWEFGGHVALRRGERSRLAQFAATAL